MGDDDGGGDDDGPSEMKFFSRLKGEERRRKIPGGPNCGVRTFLVRSPRF